MAEQKQSEQAQKEQDLCIVIVKETTIKDIKKLWNIISDWGNMSYLNRVKECVLTNKDEIKNGQVGSKRKVTLVNDLGSLDEVVTSLDNDKYCIGYTIDVNTPILPVENYSAISQLKQAKDGENVTWEGTLKFKAKKGVTNDKALDAVKAVVLGTMVQIINYAATKE